MKQHIRHLEKQAVYITVRENGNANNNSINNRKLSFVTHSKYFMKKFTGTRERGEGYIEILGLTCTDYHL